MALDRTWFNALVDDDGSNTVGTVWNKAQIDALLDSVDAALISESRRTVWTPALISTVEGNDVRQAGVTIDCRYHRTGDAVYYTIYTANLTLPAPTAALRIWGLPLFNAGYSAYLPQGALQLTVPGVGDAWGYGITDPGNFLAVSRPNASWPAGAGAGIKGQGWYYIQ